MSNGGRVAIRCRKDSLIIRLIRFLRTAKRLPRFEITNPNRAVPIVFWMARNRNGPLEDLMDALRNARTNSGDLSNRACLGKGWSEASAFMKLFCFDLI